MAGLSCPAKRRSNSSLTVHRARHPPTRGKIALVLVAGHVTAPPLRPGADPDDDADQIAEQMLALGEHDRVGGPPRCGGWTRRSRSG
jgi:hypothetical protein